MNLQSLPRTSRRLPWLPVLCAVLAGGCGGGGGGDSGGGGGGGGGEPTGPVTISGKAQYQFPPPGGGCQGLDFDAVELRPIRQATIQVLNAATNAVLDGGVTDDNGDFALTVDPGVDVFIRVRAELKQTGAPSWDVEVRDNTTTETTTGTPLALNARPLYVLDSAVFDSGTADSTRDVTAATGWTGSSYTGTRAAAPFAVLDTVYSGISLVVLADPQAVFEPLDVFWSVNNRPADGDVDDGDIGTSFYSSANNLFLLGQAGSDADEFDDHVVAHEWGHYFEDAFSRSDSIGGRHALGERLDMRVAFGEGWATALSGMALDNPIYCDTTQTSGFSINIEGGSGGAEGWFSEVSVMKIVYDVWDTAPDSADADAVSLGFGPIYNVMTGAQAATPAFTSIFSFTTALKAENPGPAPLIDDLLEEKNIMGSGAFADNETNDGGEVVDVTGVPDVLPVYTTIVPDGSTIEICSNSQFDLDGGGNLNADGNKLSEHRFLRMNIETPAQYAFEIITTTDLPPDDANNDRDQSDPDIHILLNGEVQNRNVDGDLQGFSGVANEEVFTTPNVLAAGEYVMALVEFRYQDEETPEDYPPQTCFDVTVSPAP